MNQLNTTDKDIVSHIKSLSPSSSPSASYLSNPISLLSNNKIQEEEKPIVYFKYNPSDDSDLVDLNDESDQKICCASKYLNEHDESGNDLEQNGYLEEKFRLLDKPLSSKSLINGIKSQGQLITNNENSSSILQKRNGCLDSTIQEDDDDDNVNYFLS